MAAFDSGMMFGINRADPKKYRWDAATDEWVEINNEMKDVTPNQLEIKQIENY